MDKKDTFVLHAKYLTQVEKLDMGQRGMLFTAILSFASGKEIPQMDPVTEMLYCVIEEQLKEDFEKYRYRYTDLLLEVKFCIVSKHLPDDSDKFAGTVPKCIVMRPAFSPLGIIISLEGCVVSDNVPSCIYKGIS